jgi:hypothetical protein
MRYTYKMASLANIFSATFAFFIGLVLIFAFNPIVGPLIELISDTALRLVVTFMWWGLIFLIGLYYPLHVLTSEDRMTVQ